MFFSYNFGFLRLKDVKYESNFWHVLIFLVDFLISSSQSGLKLTILDFYRFISRAELIQDLDNLELEVRINLNVYSSILGILEILLNCDP